MIDIIGSIESDVDVQKRTVAQADIAPGRIYHFGHSNDISAFINSGDAAIAHFAFDVDWHPVEDFGRWMRGRSAGLEFNTRLSEDRSIRLMLDTTTVGWVKGTLLQISANDFVYPLIDLKASDRRLIVLELVPMGGNVSLKFNLVGEIAEGKDPRRELCWGLCSVGYAICDDPVSRLALLEELVLKRQNVTLLGSAPARATFETT